MKPDLTGVSALDHNLATRVAVGDTLTRAAQMFATRNAVSDVERDVTYRELDDTSTALARALLATGAEPQCPVAIVMANSWKFVATFFGCAKANLVALPINTALATDDIAGILADAGVRTIVVGRTLLPLLAPFAAGTADLTVVVAAEGDEPTPVDRGAFDWDELVATTAPEPLAVLVEDRDTVQCMYTSGTASRPKGVLVSHLSTVVAGLTNALQLGHRSGSTPSVLLNILPLFHTTGLNTLTLPVLATGGKVVLHKKFDPAAVLDAIEHHAVTHTLLLPVMYRELLAHPGARDRNLTSLTHALYAMAAMPDADLDRIAEMFPNAAVVLGSGQTEVVPVTVLQWPEHRHTKAASWGAPVATVETRIVDSDGVVLGPGDTGEIVYRGPHVCSGYWNNPDANRDAFAHGRFRSGDVGHLDEDGVLWFTDRLKDVIKSGGENVSSVHVERVVTAAPGVAECSVVGVPHERWGESVCAVVVPTDPDTDDAELGATVVAYCKTHLAGFQVPKRVVVVPALPKTATGKARKNELRTLITGTPS